MQSASPYRDVELDASPERVFSAVASGRYAAFLDTSSARAGGRAFSYVACCPELVLRARGRRIEVERHGRLTRSRGDPLEALRGVLRESRPPGGDAELGPAGGLTGYLGYELGGRIETLPMTRRDDLHAPDLYLCRYDTVWRYDHSRSSWSVSSSGGRSASRSRRELEDALQCIDGEQASAKGRNALRSGLSSNFTRQGYLAAVRRAKRYIRDGDIYQVNLSQRFTGRLTIAPWDLYRRLRKINPAPYSCYLAFPGLVLASSSPELYLRVRGREVETWPIKGTRKRGRTPSEDRVLREELRASLKDRAELSMIVDLERNDLGRVCELGSVRVRRHARVERYATVFHTVSTVTGRLEEGRDAVDLLRATFPGGSITGCPKIRSMEIIDELEPTTRGPYTGSIGWLGGDGSMELNLAIRTFVVKGSRVSFQVGGAIVADSDPELEYQETLDKAAALMRSLGVEGFEP